MRACASLIPAGVALGLLLGLAGLGPRGHAQAPVPTPVGDAPRTVDGFVQAHCLSCHNDRARVGGFSLTGARAADAAAHPDVWEPVLHKLRTRQMPPPSRPRPEAAWAAEVQASLVAALDGEARRAPRPGRTGAHRLNRAEYANAVRDVLGLEVDVRALLLPDEADEGFDNVAASLTLSPAHLERYLTAAREISRLAVGDAALAATPAAVSYRVPKLLEQDRRVDAGQPFGSRGGATVMHQFPADGDYAVAIRLRRQVYDYIIGMGTPQLIDVRIDGRRAGRLRVGGEAPGLPGPMTWNGEIVGETPWELYMHAADRALSVPVTVTAGPHEVSVTFVDTPWVADSVDQPLAVDFGRGSDEQYDGLAAVDMVTIIGPQRPGPPGDTPSRRRLFVCRPSPALPERACAERIIGRVARRAYRRTVTTADLAPLLAFYEQGAARGGFEAGVQAALERLLVSVPFLFRLEHDPSGPSTPATYRLSDVDLASRLSFFLWSSVPDEALLDLAEAGRLSQPDVLGAQVGRMLADPRADTLVTNFAFQWLGLRKVEAVLPDANVFPEFDENLRRALLEEARLFVGSQLRNDRPLVELVSADYSFINARLAEHYGIAGVHTDLYRRHTFTDGVRGGVLGLGAMLLATSYPDRTTPVLRGTWILDTLLGMPPPPPPPDIPDLAATDEDGRPLTMRAQMERHRRNPACASCHSRMDPLGFSLEQFDAVGRVRTHVLGQPVDASAVFADGTPIDGVAGLRRFVLSRTDGLRATLAARMLTYAIGRQLTVHDQPAVRAIEQATRAGGDTWSALVQAVVRAVPFQMRSRAAS